MDKKPEKRTYEPPQVKDLRDLSLYGQWPLATHGCEVGSGNTDHTCVAGTDELGCLAGASGQ
jgi:hypothetical protein